MQVLLRGVYITPLGGVVGLSGWGSFDEWSRGQKISTNAQKKQKKNINNVDAVLPDMTGQ